MNIYQRSKRVTVTLAAPWMVWILRTSNDLLEYIKSRSISSCNDTKTIKPICRLHNYSHSNLTDRFQLCFIKKRMIKVDMKGQSKFVKTTLIQTKSYLKLTSIKCSSFFFINIFVMFGVRVFQESRHSYEYQLCSSTCSFRMKQTLCSGFWRKTKRIQNK